MQSWTPIVFQVGADPVAVGLVGSLSRPGGNLTGVTSLASELTAKRLELLRDAVPAATIIAFLVNPTNPSAENISRDAQAAAHVLGLQLHVVHASTERIKSFCGACRRRNFVGLTRLWGTRFGGGMEFSVEHRAVAIKIRPRI